VHIQEGNFFFFFLNRETAQRAETSLISGEGVTVHEKDLTGKRNYNKVLVFCTTDLRITAKNAIRSSSIFASPTNRAMANHGDTGDKTTWVTAAGANHSEVAGPPEAEVD
jgi:hypothetical protein